MVVLIFSVSVFFFEVRGLEINHVHSVQRKEAYLSTKNFIEQNYKNRPVLIIPFYYGCPYQEYSLDFGKYWGGPKMGELYAPILKQLYSDVYI